MITLEEEIMKLDLIASDAFEGRGTNEFRQLAEWLRELKELRDFASYVAESVMEEDWEYRSDFYAEVLCRKLTKLGKLKVVDNKYVEVSADED